jgi:hypothetical protein
VLSQSLGDGLFTVRITNKYVKEKTSITLFIKVQNWKQLIKKEINYRLLVHTTHPKCKSDTIDLGS